MGMIKVPINNPVAVGIVGTGVCLPDKVLTNIDIEKIVDTTDEWIRDRTGIQERRIAGHDTTTSDMGVKAALMAIENAGITPADVDLIVLGTITPDMPFPATACVVQDKIGAYRAAAFDLSAGCSGFVYALGVGSQFIQTGMYKTVLVIGAETLSRSLNWNDRNTCVLFGDGAGAAVLKRVEEGFGILAVEMGASGSGSHLLSQPAGGARMPITRENFESAERYLNMSGREVYKFAVKIMGESALMALGKAGLGKMDIDCLIPHQANIRIIETAAKRLDLPLDKVYINVQKYGNTSAASIPVALHEAFTEGRIKKGDNVVLVGFGAGLTWGTVVMRWAI